MAQITTVCLEWVHLTSQSLLERQMTKIRLIVKMIQLLDTHLEALAETTAMAIH